MYYVLLCLHLCYTENLFDYSEFALEGRPFE